MLGSPHGWLPGPQANPSYTHSFPVLDSVPTPLLPHGSHCDPVPKLASLPTSPPLSRVPHRVWSHSPRSSHLLPDFSYLPSCHCQQWQGLDPLCVAQIPHHPLPSSPVLCHHVHGQKFQILEHFTFGVFRFCMLSLLKCGQLYGLVLKLQLHSKHINLYLYLGVLSKAGPLPS
jgi:hypothetical protein